MQILIIGNSLLAKELRSLGHKAITIGTWSSCDVRINPDDFQLDSLLEKTAALISPDIILQIETLGPHRFVIEGLEKRKVPAFFYALDCHLNMAWQKY